MQKLNEYYGSKYKNQSQLRGGTKCWKETIRLLALSRNAIVVVAGTLAAFLFEVNGSTPFLLTGNNLRLKYRTARAKPIMTWQRNFSINQRYIFRGPFLKFSFFGVGVRRHPKSEPNCRAIIWPISRPESQVLGLVTKPVTNVTNVGKKKIQEEKLIEKNLTKKILKHQFLDLLLRQKNFFKNSKIFFFFFFFFFFFWKNYKNWNWENWE